MKRVITMLCVAAFLVALPLSSSLQAKGHGKDKLHEKKIKEKKDKKEKKEKVKKDKKKDGPTALVCCIEDYEGYTVDAYNRDGEKVGTYHFGIETTVLETDVPEHRDHGDPIDYISGEEESAPILEFISTYPNIPTPDCSYLVLDEVVDPGDGGGTGGPIGGGTGPIGGLI